MNRLMNWLKGKKTYIAAALLAALGVFLVWRGAVDMGMYCILSGAAYAGLGAKATRNQAEILQTIQDAGRVVTAIENKNGTQLPGALVQVGLDGYKLVKEVELQPGNTEGADPGNAALPAAGAVANAALPAAGAVANAALPNTSASGAAR